MIPQTNEVDALVNKLKHIRPSLQRSNISERQILLEFSQFAIAYLNDPRYIRERATLQTMWQFFEWETTAKHIELNDQEQSIAGCKQRTRELEHRFEQELLSCGKKFDAVGGGVVLSPLRIEGQDACSFLPKEQGIYFLIDAQLSGEKVAYIGKSNNIHTRWKSHSLSRKLTASSVLRWATSFTHYSMDRWEARLIGHFKPALNKHHVRLRGIL